MVKKSEPGGKPRVIYWFRTDLRLHDSPALKAALDLNPDCLFPLWCWDPHYVYRIRGGPNRWQILIDCLHDVSSSLTKLNSKQKLLLIREGPLTLLPKLFKEWNITHLVFEKDTDAYAKDRDAKVRELAEKAGVEVLSPYGRTLWDSDEIVKANGGKPTMSASQLGHAGEKLGQIPRPIPAPKAIPDPGETSLKFKQTLPQTDPDWFAEHRTHDDKSYSKLAGPNDDFGPPTLEELGFATSTSPHKGGETVALATLDKVMKNEDYAATFEKPKTAPTAFDPPDTTVLSHHMHFGSLSCREFYWRAQDLHDKYKKSGKKVSEPPTSLTGQILFRDMYFAAQAALGHTFSQTIGNGYCRFIPWHLPTNLAKVDPDKKAAKDAASTDRMSPAPEPTYSIDSSEAEKWFQRWKRGLTGFPFVDALMRQLRIEGWIHHLGRHMVACFLTRGGCYIDWQRGAEVFEEWLIDHEVACNVGNWQWLSCSAFYSQFYRCYSPVAFCKKWGEAQGASFIKKFVPELRELPDRYIFEPHKAPIQDQKAAGVRVSGDGSNEEENGTKLYPKPMFDFSERREICIQAMKKAYGVHLYGNDPKVLDGTWRKLFDDDAEGPTEGTGGLPGAMLDRNDEEHDDIEDEDDEERDTSSKRKRTSLGGSNSPEASRPKKKGAQGTLDNMVKRGKH